MLVKAMHPTRKIARAVGEHRVRGQQTADGVDDARHVNVTRQGLWLEVIEVVGVGLGGPSFPRQLGGCCQHLERTRCGVHGGQNRQVGLVHTVEFFGAGMNVHQRLLRLGGLQQGVAAGGHFAQAGADGQNQIALAHTLRKFGVDANAHITRVLGVVVVECVLKTKGIAHGQFPVFSKTLQGLRGLRRPATATGNHERAFGRQQHFAQLAQSTRVAPSFDRLYPRQGARTHLSHQHVFGQDQHYWAGATVHGGGEGTGHIFGNALGVIDALNALGHASGAGAKEAVVVDLLKGFAVAKVAADIAHKQHHGGAVLKGRVHPDRGIGGPRPSGDKTNAWTAR